ncbi:cupin domain-containing protein [Litorilinea aerophila]|uniref:Cupin domain-containing protein n=1 Tax=Litorilinea aerophila TaxID=1204385 RepID=A0A540VJ01_9CHLR|nr:cupin domain-containing protein [Litorilinea aerophila]MCC9076130.1 cupin domain-containing protein [Litorilinea aerophila]GIV78829.1 MAG: hypothetical protein KatS3mg050_3223 [Litorilinea sp.]
MADVGQLNIHSYKNLRSQEIQQVPLFQHEELHAELLVIPPGQSIGRHSHPDRHELLDVVEGSGTMEVGGLVCRGAPGKCLFVPADTPHSLHNDTERPWVLRVTYQERLFPRHLGRLVVRALRGRLTRWL